jgi:hypothetical protein
MQATKTTTAQQLQEEILNLQRTAFYGRYGDYFAEICNKLKLAAERGKLPGWQTLSKVYWSDVARRVDTESPVYQRHLNGETGLQAEMPTTYAITVACYNIGLDPVDTLQIVKQYGIRNDLLHANLLPMIKKGLFADLAKRLCLDRTEIVLLAPASEQADRNIVERLLDSMIDLWFDREESDLANYQMWTAKLQLKAYYRELNLNSPIENEVAVNQKISEDITKAFKKNLQKSMKEDELAELFGKLTGTKLPPKRVASSQLESEREKLTKRKKDWAAIVNLTSNAKSLYDAYILAGNGETGEPRDIVEGLDL